MMQKRLWPRVAVIAVACLIGGHVAAVSPANAAAVAATPAPRAVFAGYDSQGHLNLWVTDGASAGTHELTVASASPTGLFSSYANEPIGSLIARPEFTPFGKKLLFIGNDKAGRLGLWVTDGTAAGTREIKVSGAYAEGLWPGPFVVIGSKALFAGATSRTYLAFNENVPEIGLWVTDGTSGGTREIKVVGADSFGLSPGPFVVIGSKVLFAGVAASASSFPLWVTNGTAAGTKQLSVAGVDPDGLFSFYESVPPDFTVLGGKVLFNGTDATGATNLWVSDGSGAGTHELKGVKGAVKGLSASNLGVFNGRALFVGFSQNDTNHINLWVTNGTVAGTSKLNVARAFSRGLFETASGVVPKFIGLGKNVLFAGLAPGGICGLWVTNGTAVGTKHLSVAGSSSAGLLGANGSCSDPDFTVLRGKALFNGFDGKGFGGSPLANLWVTDGTSAGTKELTGSGGLNPTGFAVLGTKVLFGGTNAHAFIGLWATDGTAAGTGQVVVPEAWYGGLWPSNITALPP